MWKKILKIDMEEARRLGDRYAPDDMEQARQEKINTLFNELKPAIEKTLEFYMESDNDDRTSVIRDTLVAMLRGLPDMPRLSRMTDGESKSDNKAKIEEYLSRLSKKYKK